MGAACSIDELSSIVLAGGAGARFGGRKLAARLGGRPLLAHALDVAAAVGGNMVVVVGSCPEAARLASDWANERRCAVRIVAAADQTEGMAASLRAGLEALDPAAKGAFVFLGDMPFVPPGMIPLLAAALAGGATAAAPTFGGVRGHPVLLGRGMIDRRTLIIGDKGAGGLLSGEPGLVLVEAGSDGVLFDVDTPADLAAAGARLSRAPIHPAL